MATHSWNIWIRELKSISSISKEYFVYLKKFIYINIFAINLQSIEFPIHNEITVNNLNFFYILLKINNPYKDWDNNKQNIFFNFNYVVPSIVLSTKLWKWSSILMLFVFTNVIS
jgi:hypothetical protein